GDHRADAGRGVEGGDAGASGPHALGERALRRELHLELAGEVLAGELLVGADIRGRGPGDPVRFQKLAQAETVGAAVVAHRAQVGGALLEERVDEDGGDADQTEPAHGQGGTVGDVRDRVRGRREDL